MRLNDGTRRALPWLLLGVGVIVTALVYWPGLTGGWVFDDFPNIVDNNAIHITPGHSTLAAWVNAALSSPASFLHRPLASITFALNWYAGGGDPWPFKLTNIAIHLVNGVLVFYMLRALLRLLELRNAAFEAPSHGEWDRSGTTDTGLASRPRKAEPSPAPSGHPLPKGEGLKSAIDDAAATRLALIVAVAWMLLPINLMAVLYVVQRMESLCQVFILAGLWAYLHGRWMMLTATDARRDRHGFALAVAGIVVGTLLGLTSKETAVLLPVFAFLAEAVLIRFRVRVAGIPPELRTDFLPAEAVAPSAAAIDATATGATGLPSSEKKGAAGGAHSATATFTRAALDPLQPKVDVGAIPSAGTGAAGDAHPATNDTASTPAPDRHSGAARSAEPGIRLPSQPTATPARQDKRIWTLFTVTLFVPAVLGFAWLLRGVLRPGALAGRDFTLPQRLLTETRVLVDYLRWTLLPNPEVLSLYHDEIRISTGLLTPWTTLGSMALLAALIVIAVLLRNRKPLVALGIGWFFAAQLLTATIIPLELVYEQRMYFGSIGVLLAAGALLLGLRWKLAMPLLRGFLVAVALLWFGVATNLRAQEWSNPLRQAIIEANRHPESGRAVYEAGRLLLIASNYQPGKARDEAWKYLREAAAIRGSSALPDQAMIMLADHEQHGDDAAFWDSMTRKLAGQPTRQEDISALVSLTNCYNAGICKFDPAQLQRAYAAALSRPHPIARLDGAYAAFQRDILHDDALATKYLALAVKGDPGEPAYRVDLAALYARQGETEQAVEQIDALRRMNLAGRLDGQIAVLERLTEQGKVPASSN